MISFPAVTLTLNYNLVKIEQNKIQLFCVCGLGQPGTVCGGIQLHLNFE